MHPEIAVRIKEIAGICRRYRVSRLEVYGPAARGTDFDPNTSNADFLVEFEPPTLAGLSERYRGLTGDLRALLGRKVVLIRLETTDSDSLPTEIDQSRKRVYPDPPPHFLACPDPRPRPTDNEADQICRVEPEQTQQRSCRRHGPKPDWKITGWGSRDGKAVHVSQVVSGLACECVCPNCDGRLIARKGKQRAHHFAHASATDSCNKLGESALHLACKAVIEECGEMELPVVRYHDGKSGAYGSGQVKAPTRVSFETVVQEQALGRIIPDITATVKGRTLCVEIKVTHGVSDGKALHYESLGQSAIEIDVSSLPRDASRDAIREHVVDGLDGKRWIHNDRAAEELVSCTIRPISHVYVECPLPVKALLNNLPGNGWDGLARKCARQRKVHFRYNCLECRHWRCLSDNTIFCDTTEDATQHYTEFPFTSQDDP